MFPTTNVSYVAAVFLAVAAVTSVVCDDELYKKFLSSTRDLSVELLKVACQAGKNTIMSPTSVSMLLAVLQQGARGTTARELSRVLGVDDHLAKIGYRNLSRSFAEKTRGVTVEWGNRVYTKPGLNIHPSFKEEIETSFGSAFEEINFPDDKSQLIADTINKWISESTHGQIREMIEPRKLTLTSDMINADTIMLLVNIMYFKGNWRNRFREKNTRTDNFEKSPSESVSAPFMYQRNKFQAGRNATLGVKWVELPFESDTHKMLFVLPLKRHSLKKILSRFTGDDLLNMVNYGDVTDVRLRIPKFKLEGKLSLVELLKTMGVREVFTGESNLSGISSEPLQISDAFHQANIEVDERGSTASAATVITLSRKLILSETFRLDQPFLFFVIDASNNLPLFAGKIADPTAS